MRPLFCVVREAPLWPLLGPHNLPLPANNALAARLPGRVRREALHEASEASSAGEAETEKLASKSP